VSGAFGVFHRDTVVEAAGFRADVIGEDMELIVEAAPHAVGAARVIAWRSCRTRCAGRMRPDLGTLARQRKRWQRGLAESLWENRRLCFARGSGVAGWIAFPYFVLFELLSPLVEIGGLVLMAVAFALGMMSGPGFLAFMVAAFALGVMLSTTSILLEELSFRTYPKARHVLVLFAVSLLENFGYRQLASFWRLQALISWFAGRPIHWGVMKRKADWQQ
jgi:cellulose synthase/poly-beta-1,6-N-acetylglucosamine synthase-like glycosyltransferase